MKRPVGRPTLKLGLNLYSWVLIELLRDTPNNEPRRSVRKAAKKLARELRLDWRGGEVKPWETLRDYYKNFDRAMAADSELAARAHALLEIGRRGRELFGWDASPWQWVIAPWQFKNYALEIQDNKIRLTRQLSTAGASQ
jgi:hypothetical protein